MFLLTISPANIVAILFGTLFLSTQAKHFEFKDPQSGRICVLLDVKYNITIQALKDKNVAATKTLTEEDEGVSPAGLCDEDIREIILWYPGKMAYFAILFQPASAAPVGMYRNTQFTPQDVFPDIEDSQKWGFSDPHPLYLKSNKDSFRCNKSVKTDYVPYLSPKSDYDFKVEVTLLTIQTQAFNIVGDQYGPPEDC